jgi:hypothetical protein
VRGCRPGLLCPLSTQREAESLRQRPRDGIVLDGPHGQAGGMAHTCKFVNVLVLVRLVHERDFARVFCMEARRILPRRHQLDSA